MGFEYEQLELKNASLGAEGSFDFGKTNQSLPEGQTEGSFEYGKMPVSPNNPPPVWGVITWGTFCFGDGHTFGQLIEIPEPESDFFYANQGLSIIESMGEQQQFDYQQNNLTLIPSIEGDFEYRRQG